jgi:hypothetical protein
MIRARYERRGPVPQDVIHPEEFEAPRLSAGQALVEVVAAPINPSDVMTLTGEYGQLPPLPRSGAAKEPGGLPNWARAPATSRSANWSCCRSAAEDGPPTWSLRRHS